MCGWRSLWRRIWSRKSCWWTKCWLSAASIFRKSAWGKMVDVARAGRTVVLVSHQMNQMRRLCHRVVWIDGGQVRQSGPTHEVVSAYESTMKAVDLREPQFHGSGSL